MVCGSVGEGYVGCYVGVGVGVGVGGERLCYIAM